MIVARHYGRLFAVFAMITNVMVADARGNGEVKFIYFSYANCGDTWAQCDFYFKDIKFVDGDGEETTIGRKDAPENEHYVDLTKVIPEVTTVALATKGTVTLSMKIWEEDIISDDHLMTVNENIDFSSIDAGDGWQEEEFVLEDGAKLTISRKITSCDDNFTGLGCNNQPTAQTISSVEAGVGAGALLLILGIIAAVCLVRRHRKAARECGEEMEMRAVREGEQMRSVHGDYSPAENIYEVI